MKVLVVDDSKTCRTLYRRELVNGGYDVLEASDGVQALEIVEQHALDLVVLDIEMPNMNGYEVCERLRSSEFTTRFSQKREGVLPVIFVTSNESVEFRVKGFNKGANGFITKGFKPGTLLDNVNRILKPVNPMAGLQALVVEDSRFLRQMITGFLKENGVKVTASESCERAFELLMHNSDSYNMVITALEMPAMKGDQLCKHIRQDLGLKTMPVLVLTDTDDRNLLMSLFESGASDYLVKPFEKEELLARLKASLEMVRTLEKEIEARLWLNAAEKGDNGVVVEEALDQAKMATTVLHNIGNVLNSVFACCYQMSRIIKDSRLRQLLMAHQLLEDNLEDLGTFISEDPKGKLLPEYLLKSGRRVEDEHVNLAREIEEISTKINLMKDIIETQNLHAKTKVSEFIDLHHVVNDSIKVQEPNLKQQKVQLEKRLEPVELIVGYRVPLVHVLINLIKNAIEAMRDSQERRLCISTGCQGEQNFIELTDTGHGISLENQERIFNHGFTTKKDGHGFGLAFCEKAVREMGGTLQVTSPGEGLGATFRLEFVTAPEDGGLSLLND